MLAEVHGHREGGHRQGLDTSTCDDREQPSGAGRARSCAVETASACRWPGAQILEQVSFAIGPGEFTGLIGSNGAGKTTLLRVILGLQRPGSGQVHVLGQRRSPRVSRRLRAAEGAARPRHADARAGPGRARPRRAAGSACAAVAPARPGGRRRCCTRSTPSPSPTPGSGNLSGGEQQRVLIAHALISRPAAAAARRAAGEPGPAQRPGDHQPAARIVGRAADRGAALRARDEPAAAGDGPHRLPRRRPRGERHDRRGHPHRRAQRACTATTSTC